MKYFRKRKTRQSFSVVMAFLLLFSLAAPGMGNAAEPDFNDFESNSLEEDLQLEKEREQDAASFDREHNTNQESSEGLPHLLDGLGIDLDETKPSGDFLLNGKLEAEVADILDEEGTVDVIIRMAEQADYDELYEQAQGIDLHGSRVGSVVSELQTVAESSQQTLLNELEPLEEEGLIQNIQSYWVFNGMSATISGEALDYLAEREDIERITLDREIDVPDVDIHDAPPRLPEWGLEKVFAPQVWGEYGIKGQGTVVGIMDTGVAMEHEALSHNYRGNDGEHQYSWIDVSGQGYSEPADGHGHGTHVAGTAVGGGGGEPIGVAPEAEWIAAKIFTDGGSATTSGIHEAFEWFLAPGGDPEKAPHVVNNSWGNANTYNTEFYEGVQAWVAAGIFPLFSAGNEGPGAQTIGSPASFPDSYAVGATDINDQIASFSSRGPVFWDDEDGNSQQYLKPEISAPGHQIYSAWPDGGYNTISGTSMASPHIAGIIALVLQANPDLSIAEVKDLLERTARGESHMGSLPNMDYGYGIANVYQAVTEAAFAGHISGELENIDGNPIPGTISIPAQNFNLDVDEDGEFSFSIREGTHDATVSSFGYEDLEVTFTIEQDEHKSFTWVLEESDVYDLTGTVLQEGSNDPVEYAYVRVLDTPVSPVRTNENGEFSLTNLPEDEYELLVSAAGFKAETFTVNLASDQNVELHLQELAVSASDEWPTGNNNPQRNAVTNADIDGGQLDQGWNFDSPGALLFNSPSVADDAVVFTTDRGYIISVDAHTGEENWSVSTGNTNRSTPTIHNGTVYAAGGSNRNIYAIDLDSGLIDWSTQLDTPAVYETPVYKDGTVYVSAQWNNDAKLTALDAATGDKLWDTVVGDGAAFGATYGSNNLLIGLYEGRELKSLSPVDGSVNWTFATGTQEGFASQSVYVDGVVYAFSADFGRDTGTLWAIDNETGEELWSTGGIGDTQAVSPIVYGDVVIAGSASNPTLKGFDRSTGELVWENDYINTMFNNGAVTGNGQLLVTDSARALHVLDAQTGNHLYQYSLPDSSYSGVAVTEGQVIVGHQSGVTSFESRGTLLGTIEDADGNPVEGKVTLVGTDYSVTADENGHFELQALPGTYHVRVASYGLKQVSEEITFSPGVVKERHYTLGDASTGTVSGTVTDEQTEEPLEGVSVELLDTPEEDVTGTDGSFNLGDVYEGTYELQVSYGGYLDTVQTVQVQAGEHLEVSVGMTPIDIAVLNDYDGEITRFLNANDYPSEERDWDIVDDLENYEALYLNGAYGSGGWQPSEEEFTALLDAANEHDVNVVFADTWAISYGSIRHLVNFYGDPGNIAHEYMARSIDIRIDQEHPITGGLPVGERLAFDSGSDFAWFTQYSGRHLATVGSDRTGYVGSGVAYKGVSEDSAHVLLGSHAASPWTSPYNNWLQPKHQILLNTMDYLTGDVEFGQLYGTATDADGEPLEVNIEVGDTGVSTKSDPETGEFSLFHDEGTFEVSFRKSGFTTLEEEVTFEHGGPFELDVQFDVSEGGSVFGEITNYVTGDAVPYVEIELLDEDGELVREEVANINGYYEFAGLGEDIYTLEYSVRDYVTHTEVVDVRGEPIELDVQMYPSPDVAIIGDYSISSSNLRLILNEVGIEADNYTNVNAILGNTESYDVVFFNQSGTGTNAGQLEQLQEELDENQVSIVVGDDFSIGNAGLQRFVDFLGDPETRERHQTTSSSAAYVVSQEHPVFGSAEEGDVIEILNPDRSRVGVFDGYTGMTLGDLKFDGDDDVLGTGVAYLPRTGNSVELIMGGHGLSFNHNANDYTEAGRQMFIDALLWSAYETYNTIDATVMDEDGNPLYARAELEETGQSTWTDPETGSFMIAAEDGTYTLTIESFGYDTKTIEVELDSSLEPFSITLDVDDAVGSLEGQVFEEQTLESAIPGAHVDVVGEPREAVTDASGMFEIERLMPGTYDIVVEADGYVIEEFEVVIEAEETTEITVEMKPSPTVGVIGDAFLSSQASLEDYLEPRGWIVEEVFYTDDAERFEEVDIVFANSVFNTYTPEEDEFIEFLKEVDKTATPIIWTGQHGGQGSMEYLSDYTGDPGTINRGNTAGDYFAHVQNSDHPILEGVDEEFEVLTNSNYYYAYDNYTGETIVDLSHSNVEDVGSMVGFKGRTVNSVEVLLANMTIGPGFHMNDSQWDENRVNILNNTLLWVLDNEEAYAGELHGSLVNNFDREVYASITVEETGYTFDTEQDGTFFLGLAEGTYNLTVNAFGHEEQTFEVEFVNGQVKEETFELTSEDAGLLTGQITAEDTEGPIEGATVALTGTPLTAVTDENGEYELQAPVGTFQARVSAPGYTPHTQEVTFEENEVTELNVTLSVSEKIALIGSSNQTGMVADMLNDNGYEVEQWTGNIEELFASLDEYALAIMNHRTNAIMDMNQFDEFLELADENHVSIIFTSQWAANPIRDLSNATGNPAVEHNGFVPGHINYEVTQNHPIFSGFSEGDTIEIANNGSSNQQYGMFEEYSGTTIANLTNDETGYIGEAVAYDFRTANNVHLLLGSLQSSSYGSPNSRWTDDAKQIYFNAVDWAITASLGEITGTVTDEDGKPISGATVSVPEENIQTTTNSNGHYTIGIGLGEHEVHAEARGYLSDSAVVEVEELGESVEQNFSLEATDRASVSGEVLHTSSEDPIEGANVTIVETGNGFEDETVTDSSGEFTFSELLAGDYEVTVSVTGYLDVTQEFSLEEGEHIDLTFLLSDYNIAILGDLNSTVSSFLEGYDMAAESRDWGIVNDVYNYEVIVVNDENGTEEQVQALLDASDEYEVSLVFVDTWGVDTGSIQLLERAQGYPQQAAQGYNQGAVALDIHQEHPIFDGLDTENLVTIHPEGGYYATFENFAGHTLANAVVDGDDKGASVAYEFRSANHVHLLLSTFMSNNMTGPDFGWTADGKQLYAQAVDWARSAELDLPEAPEWDELEVTSTEAEVTLTGTAVHADQVEIYVDGSHEETVDTDGSSFTVDLTLEDGSYDVRATAVNDAGSIDNEQDAHVTVMTAPSFDEEGTVYTNEAVYELTGTVLFDGTLEVYRNGELVNTVETEDHSFSAQVELVEGENTLEAKLVTEDGETGMASLTVIKDTDAPELTITSPEDGAVTGTEAVTVTGEAADDNLASVTVNEEEADVAEDGSFTRGLVLSEGEHTITVMATDLAGNETTEQVTITVDLTGPAINDLEPSEDLHVKAGDTVEVSFTSDTEGGDAFFSLKLPISSSSDSKAEMTEVEPGVYEGSWQVPADLSVNGAIVEVEITDGAGNRSTAEADGRIYVTASDIDRIYGENRYETAVQVSQSNWDSSDTVILVRGNDYADALAGTPLAHQHGAPMLLTHNDRLNEASEAEIERLGAEHVIILGGTNAVEEGVEQTLESMGLTVERIAGDTRFETAALIAEHVAPEGTDTAVVANGQDFPDALSVASHAANAGMPILLTRSGELPEETGDVLGTMGVSDTLVIGGTTVVSDDVAADLPDPHRLSGENRFGTNAAVNEYFQPDTTHMYVATGIDFADALTGAVVAADHNTGILLTGSSTVHDSVADYISDNGVHRLTIFGGTSAVSHDIAEHLYQLIN
ncbi:hypothetical protein CR205_17890 [Alteribacter lacisalsi]|uniref:PEGA domain-containing protein n=1 Tax=Alteribacter lacisalsi TaxID=2045244 RepID=A0A2W0H5D0_9BACI|nr:carboxypeptidase regulatory-like domain-containing protein [Alteribacter lacisalsi]PYZ96231.1 hypothetical protein CR205_17890 [Alteribacter lacisalsi]